MYNKTGPVNAILSLYYTAVSKQIIYITSPRRTTV